MVEGSADEEHSEPVVVGVVVVDCGTVLRLRWICLSTDSAVVVLSNKVGDIGCLPVGRLDYANR